MTEKNKLWGASKIIKKQSETSLKQPSRLAWPSPDTLVWVARTHIWMMTETMWLFQCAFGPHVNYIYPPRPPPEFAQYCWNQALVCAHLGAPGQQTKKLNHDLLYWPGALSKTAARTKLTCLWLVFGPRIWSQKKLIQIGAKNVNKNVDLFSAPNLGRIFSNYDFGTFSFIFHTRS